MPQRLQAFHEHRALTPLLAGAVGILLALCTVLGGSPEEVLAALPAILLAIFLSCGLYPGEELVLRLAARRRRRPRARASRVPRPHRAALSPRLALLAGSQPERGPPSLAIPLIP